MVQPWTKYMKLGVIHFMLYPNAAKEGKVLETLERIVLDEFFSVVEVTRFPDDATRDKAKQLLQAGQMTVAFGAQPVLLGNKLSLNDLDESRRRQAVDLIKECVDEAYELGAVGLAFLAGPDPGDADRDKAKGLLKESIQEICEYAASKGDLRIVLEVFDRDIEKKSLIGPSVEAGQFAAAVRKECPNFGLMHDLSHVPLLRESSLAALWAVKDQLVHVHIGNCSMRDASDPAYGDYHPRFGLPGSEVDIPALAEFLQALFTVGYLKEGCKDRPIVSFEVKPLPGESSEIVLANAKRSLIEAWAML